MPLVLLLLVALLAPAQIVPGDVGNSIPLLTRPALPSGGTWWGLGSPNLILQSEGFSNAVWEVNNATKTIGQADPAGGTNAVLVTAVGTPALNTEFLQTFPATSGVTYTTRVIAKAGTGAWLKLRYNLTFGLAGSDWKNFHLAGDGAVGLGPLSGTIEHLGGGWYLCTLTGTAAATGAPSIRFTPMESDVNAATTTTAAGISVTLYAPQVNSGTTPLPYTRTTDLQSFPAIPTSAASLVRGANTGAATDDPVVTRVGLVFAVDDRVSGIPAKGAAWTVLNCTTTVCDAVDSAGGKYRNGAANAAAEEFNIETAGGFTGTLTGYLRINRVLNAGEQARLYHRWAKPRINAAGGTLP